MLRNSGGPGAGPPQPGGTGPRRLRLLALTGGVAAAVVLPLAVASAGQVRDAVRGPDAKERAAAGASPQGAAGSSAEADTNSPGAAGGVPGSSGGAAGNATGAAGGSGSAAGSAAGASGDGTGAPAQGAGGPSAAPRSSPFLLGLGLATAARCGPQLTSPDGIEAQTCVLTQGMDTWGRTYYRNATGESLDSVLSLMGPAGRTVQMRCVTGADDEPATCETPREHSRGAPDAYTAVTEFAAHGGDGPLLLRSGSNSELQQGS